MVNDTSGRSETNIVDRRNLVPAKKEIKNKRKTIIIMNTPNPRNKTSKYKSNK